MTGAIRLAEPTAAAGGAVTFGVCATCDPRIGAASRQRAVNIVEMAAEALAARVRMPDGTPARVVWSAVLIDGERQADLAARQFKDAGVEAICCVPDTWAFPQLTLMSLLAHFRPDLPVNITCGNSGPKPGVVFAHAVNGALAQSGRLAALNVGSWPDTGRDPRMTDATADALADWAYAALTRVGLRGKRVLILGHDSMGMETALAHVIATRNAFGIEVTRLDMKLLADLLAKRAYDRRELKALRAWIDQCVGRRLKLRDAADGRRFDQSLAMYLIVRDLSAELGAVGGGFMSQLEWGSDLRGRPLPVADVMESLFNSTFDHTGEKPALPFATEADVQGLLTMLFFTWLSAGNPPLFMDFRKVWEPAEIRALAEKLGVDAADQPVWAERGFVDGDNSGSASFNWAATPGATAAECMKHVSLPLADPAYFPGGGNSVAFTSPGGIEGIAGRMAYCGPKDRWSLIWDLADTVELPAKLAAAVRRTSTATWPHTWVCPRFATMAEYKQYAPANHLHMTWGLAAARLEHWMDLTGVASVTPWAARPASIPGVDRPKPLLHLIGG